MTSRLPTPGGDTNTWGNILNDFLQQAHNSDGSLLSTAVMTAVTDATTGAKGKVQLAGDLAGTAASPIVAKINGVTMPGSAPSATQVLTATSTTATAWSTPVILDTTGTDIQPLGTQAAGAIGKAADAGHVHVMPRLDQVSAPTASVSLNTQKITNLATPTLSADASRLDDTTYVPSYASGLNMANRFSWIQGTYNYKSSNTRHADQGMTNASRGVGGTNIPGYTRELVIGDSVTAGCTSGVGTVTYSRGDAWPYAMRDTLSLWGIPANGSGISRVADGPAARNLERYTYDANWVNNVTYLGTSTNGATMTFNADRPGTIVDVFYADGFNGTFTISVNNAASGAGFATVTGAAVVRTGKKRLSGVSVFPGSTVKLTVTTLGTGVGIIGVSVWSPNAGLIIDNIAQSGSRTGGTAGTSTWTDTTTNTAPWQVYGGTYKGGISGKTRLVTDIATTSGSATITSATASFDADRDTGEPIDFLPHTTLGIAFTPGTYISSVTNSTTAVLSTTANYTASGATAQSANICRDPSTVHICLGGNDLQNSRTGAQIKTDMIAFINTIRTQWPYTDVILHLENELAPSLASSAQELDMQQNMYQVADNRDVPLFDWRDRAGSFATAMANGIYNDPVAHMTPSMYVNLGASLAFARSVAGSGPSQAVRGPTLPNDTVPMWYADGYRRFSSPQIADNAVEAATWTTTERVQTKLGIPPNTVKVGTTFRLVTYGSYTATVVGANSVRLRAGTAGTISDTQAAQMTPTNPAATGAGYYFESYVTFRTIGASASIMITLKGHFNGQSETIFPPATATVDSSAMLYLSLTIQATSGTVPVGTSKLGFVDTIQN